MTGQAPLLPGSPLVGSALELRADMLGTIERAFREHGDVVRMRLGPRGAGREMTFVYHPDGVQHILAGHAGNYRKDNVFYGEVRDAFGDGLLTSQDDDWQRQKRFLQPLFTARRVIGYATTMADQVDAVVRRWRAEPAAVRDLHDEMTRLTLRIVCRVLFGNDIEQALPVVQHRFGPLGEAVRARSMAPVRVPASWPTPTNRRLHRARRELFGVCDDIIAARRSGAVAGRGTDLLGMLLDARDGDAALSDIEIRDQVLIFLLAGHETTSTALAYTLDLLGRHPDVQAKVRDEVDAAGGTPTAALPYTTMVLKEAMRLFPSAPLTGRRSVADDEIGGFAVPAGADVVVVPWVTHRHPAYWDDPERFDPERFTPDRERARHRYAWFPFGGGPRACIGQHFSMLESAIVLAGLIRAFEFTTDTGVPRYTNAITLRPVGSVPARIQPRRVTAG
ncbi:cytochrome P450 [Actinoplanes sp. NPDC049548]|uniref:cytochrome P450 n=1 Tax=Actinoplanes sp. NPDC049548 TaxID=3155152 RepID=UPI00341FF00C